MKKLLPLLILLLTALPLRYASANHFSCISITPSSQSITLKVQSATALSEFVKVVDTTALNNSYAKLPNNNLTTIEGTDTATYVFEGLEPSTVYKALVYSSAGAFVEDIKGCSVQTKAAGGSAASNNQNTAATVFTTTGSGTQAFVPNKSGQAGGGFLLDVKLQNPLKVSTIGEAVKFFVNTLIKIAIPFIVVFFIWAGLKFILAQGKPDEIKKAKMMFWYTIIGTLLILGAWTITNAIIGTVNSITS